MEDPLSGPLFDFQDEFLGASELVALDGLAPMLSAAHGVTRIR